MVLYRKADQEDLDTERLEAEDIVKDIRRECKAPLVVPGLLDAFIKLSRLTTQTTHSDGTVIKEIDFISVRYNFPNEKSDHLIIPPTLPLFPFSANENTKGNAFFDFGIYLSH